MWNLIRKTLVNTIKKTGLTYDHTIIPKYYLPYTFMDGLTAKAPSQCDFEVTFRCNMYCDMCPQVSHREHNLHGGQIRHPVTGAFQDELSTGEIKSALSDLANGGTQTVQFTGGEAFLRKDLCEIVEHAKKCGLNVVILTNGSLITNEIAARLVRTEVDAITFSIDGPKALHNKIRHLPDGFDKLCSSVKMIRQEMINQKKDRPLLSLATVIQQQNQDELADIVDVAHSIGVNNLNFNYPFYTTPELELATWEKLKSKFTKGAKPEEQSNLTEHHNLTHKQILAQLAETRKRATEWGISFKTSPNLLDDEIPDYIQNPGFSVVQKCFYPWRNMRVNAWGDVYPCSIDVHLGNIREQGILNIWNGNKYREFRRTLKSNGLFPQCAKCCVLTNRLWNKLPKLSLSIPRLWPDSPVKGQPAQIPIPTKVLTKISASTKH